ncbi:hypothetical protein, conserved [Leishmania tarentolae]|uniref:Uncharacterized protein n=1 Tax=Leishmania tarentolae TaxID=5689 RepID=A0A640KBA2_LEITA|nr:hypothetical protein, conserved [Leishmania tarentolae]
MPAASRSHACKGTASATAAAASRGRRAAAVPSMLPSQTPATLSVDELRATPDSRLLSYLMNAYDSIRGLSLAESSAAPHPTITPFSAVYLEELLTPRLLSSPIPDVSQLVGCLLCDAVRMHHEQYQQQHRQRRHSSGSTPPYASPGGSGGTSYTQSDDAVETAGADALPFPPERCMDVLHCICTCFAKLQSAPLNTSPSAAAHQRQTLQRVAYLIERAAAAHIFCHLLPHCDLASEETQQALLWVFLAVRCASSPAAGDLGAGTRSSSVGNPTNTATCDEMAQVLRDILCSTRVVTPVQLVPLLDELVAASPTLQLMSLSAPSLSYRSAYASSARPHQHLPVHSRSGGALIATRLLLEQIDRLQPAISTWAMGEFEEGLAEVLASKVLQSDDEDLEGEAQRHGSDTDEDEWNQQRHQPQQAKTAKAPQEAQRTHKRRGLQIMAHVLEVLVALMELHVDLADQLLPALAPHLEHTCPEVRLLLLRGLGAAFAANEVAVPTYRAILMGPLLNRFLDVKPNIRMELSDCPRCCFAASATMRDLMPAVMPVARSAYPLTGRVRSHCSGTSGRRFSHAGSDCSLIRMSLCASRLSPQLLRRRWRPRCC